MASTRDITDTIEMITKVIEEETNPNLKAQIIKTLILTMSAKLTDIVAELVWVMHKGPRRLTFEQIADELGISRRAVYRSFRRYKDRPQRTNPMNVTDPDGYLDFANLMNLSGIRAGRRQTAVPTRRKEAQGSSWDRRPDLPANP